MKSHPLLAVRAVIGLVALLSFTGGAHAVITFTETVQESDIDRGMTTFLNPLPQLLIYVAADTLRGNYETPPLPGGVAGIDNEAEPFTPVTADFSTDNLLRLVVQAPAGQQFRVRLPSGVQGEMLFNLFFHTGASGVTILPDSALTVAFDGVAVTVAPGLMGMDLDGEAFSMEGSTDDLTDGMTFSQITFTLDYSVDAAMQPLTMTSGTDTLGPDPMAHLTFQSAQSTSPGNASPPVVSPVITLEPIPEPGTLALLGLAGAAFVRRR